jgi:hypothetical protein
MMSLMRVHFWMVALAAGCSPSPPTTDYTGMPCDVEAQDCPSGWKCTWSAYVHLIPNGPACVPVGPRAEGEACGEMDDCAVGLQCESLWNQYAAPTCGRVCATDSFCGSGQRCDQICYPVCTPFGSDCPPPKICSEVVALRGGLEGMIYGTDGPVCRAAGGGLPAYSHGCQSSTACVDGAVCILGQCIPLCDAQHPCPSSDVPAPQCQTNSYLPPGVSTCGWPLSG